MIGTILVVLADMILHTKFQGHQSIGSGEEDILNFFFTKYERGGLVWSCGPDRLNNQFFSPTPDLLRLFEHFLFPPTSVIWLQ